MEKSTGGKTSGTRRGTIPCSTIQVDILRHQRHSGYVFTIPTSGNILMRLLLWAYCCYLSSHTTRWIGCMPDEARDGPNVALKWQLEVKSHLLACLIVQNNHPTTRWIIAILVVSLPGFKLLSSIHPSLLSSHAIKDIYHWLGPILELFDWATALHSSPILPAMLIFNMKKLLACTTI